MKNPIKLFIITGAFSFCFAFVLGKAAGQTGKKLPAPKNPIKAEAQAPIDVGSPIVVVVLPDGTERVATLRVVFQLKPDGNVGFRMRRPDEYPQPPKQAPKTKAAPSMKIPPPQKTFDNNVR